MDEGSEELPTLGEPASPLRTQPVLAVRAAGQVTCLKSTLLKSERKASDRVRFNRVLTLGFRCRGTNRNGSDSQT